MSPPSADCETAFLQDYSFVASVSMAFLTRAPRRFCPLWRAVAAINHAREDGEGLAISELSLYELAVIAFRGRIRLDISVESFLQEVEARFVIKPLTGRISAKAMQLPESYPSDPVDRIIGATALVEGLRLITADEQIRKSKAIHTIW